jgi:hypothetical protein
MTSPPPLDRYTWAEIAAEQDGVIARFQALASGMTKHAWDWRLRNGDWKAIVPGVAVTHSGVPTDKQRAWAAFLHAGEGAALTGDVGLVQRGFTKMGALLTVDVAVAWPREVAGRATFLGGPDDEPTDWRRGGPRGGPKLVCHSLRHLSQWVRPYAGELTVVQVEAAVLHAAAWATSDAAAEWRLAAVVQQGLTVPSRIRAVLAQMPRLKRRALIRTVLDDVEFGAHAGSELAFLKFCRAYGIPEPDEMQVVVRAGGKRYLDARYRKQRVSVEVDGAHHREVEQWDADVLRTLHLAVKHHGTGETQIRVTMGNLRHTGDEVAGLLRTLLC